MTTKEWSQAATDDLAFLEGIRDALQNKADDAEFGGQPSLLQYETAVANLWLYLAADQRWYPMPVSRDDVIESLQLLSLGSIAAKIPADLRSPETALALELFGALTKCLRSHPELLELYFEHSWLTDTQYCPENLWPFDNMPAIYKLKNKPS